MQEQNKCSATLQQLFFGRRRIRNINAATTSEEDGLVRKLFFEDTG